MTKIPIKIIMIGHVDKIIDFNSIKKHSSNFFSIHSLNRLNDLPSPRKNDGYLDVVYSKEEIIDLLSDTTCDGICIGIMNYRFQDNFYMHRISDNKVCISIADLDEILSRKNISIENFIIKNIYEISSFYTLLGSSLSGNIYQFGHRDTRGCLFDLNGDKNDIIYNTEKPIICSECISKINKKSVPDSFLNTLESELKNIKKPWLKSIELFIKKYPLLSIVITLLFSIAINLLSNLFWEMIKKT